MERNLVTNVAKVYRVWHEYAAAVKAGDLDRWISVWTEDGIRMPPNASRSIGLEQIRTSLEFDLRTFHFEEYTIQPDEIRILGNQAYAHGLYSATMIARVGGETIKVSGKFLTILTKQDDGFWKITVDCYNSNKPVS
ncbi:MAG: nuclear transport factor 2 family protein [Anaerolineales bacterium]